MQRTLKIKGVTVYVTPLINNSIVCINLSGPQSIPLSWLREVFLRASILVPVRLSDNNQKIVPYALTSLCGSFAPAAHDLHRYTPSSMLFYSIAVRQKKVLYRRNTQGTEPSASLCSNKQWCVYFICMKQRGSF